MNRSNILAALAVALPFLGEVAAAANPVPYQDFVFTLCSAGSGCSADFKPMPPNARLEIEQVSCRIETENNSSIFLAQLQVNRAGGSFVGAQNLPFENVATNGAIRTFFAGGPTTMFVREAQKLRFFATTAGKIQFMECMVAGHLVSVP